LRNLAAVAGLIGLATLAVAGASRADAPAAGTTGAPAVAGGVKPVTFYAAWKAPWGTPRATDHLEVACTDEEVRDTLWLTFEPGRDSTIYGMIAEVYFRAQPGDTLGPMWWYGGGALSDVNIVMEWPKPNDPTWKGAGIPWTTNGFGAANYDRTPGSGRLKIVFAVSADTPGRVQAGKRYAFARLLILRGRTHKERCDQPICIEWGGGGVTFDLVAGEEEAPRVGGSRFVTWNSKNRRACAEYTSASAGRPWTPKPGSR
jgi:hypothetical protein